MRFWSKNKQYNENTVSTMQHTDTLIASAEKLQGASKPVQEQVFNNVTNCINIIIQNHSQSTQDLQEDSDTYNMTQMITTQKRRIT